MISRVVLATYALALAACSGNAQEDANDGDVTDSDVLGMIRWNNDLARSNYDLYCAQCACGSFLDVSADAEQCQVDVLADFPAIRDTLVQLLRCEVDKADRRAMCLAESNDCTQADACSNVADAGLGDCDSLAAAQEEALTEYSAAVQQRCAD